MLVLLRIVLVFGFCVATVGAAGFAETIEPAAPWLLIGGLVVMIAAGLRLKQLLHRAAHAEHGEVLGFKGLATAIQMLAGRVEGLSAERESLDREALCTAINELLHGPYFELGSRNEAYLRALGNADYVRLWDGFAVSERLLARAWSMATDGWVEQARTELPGAARHIRRAADEGA